MAAVTFVSIWEFITQHWYLLLMAAIAGGLLIFWIVKAGIKTVLRCVLLCLFFILAAPVLFVIWIVRKCRKDG